jgi:hypothetical protein
MGQPPVSPYPVLRAYTDTPCDFPLQTHRVTADNLRKRNQRLSQIPYGIFHTMHDTALPNNGHPFTLDLTQ